MAVDDRLGEEEHTYYSPCPQLAGRVTHFVVFSPSPLFCFTVCVLPALLLPPIPTSQQPVARLDLTSTLTMPLGGARDLSGIE
jgi:hypothetical protein